jgi:hypothetical protein
MLLHIDGWYAGGKTVLWSLLDGHQEVFVCPVHDYSFAPFFKHANNEEWVQIKYPTILRKILAKSEYYKFEKIYRDGVLPVFFSADVHMDLPYQTDFYRFDKRFFDKLDELEVWDIESIIETLYAAFYAEHTGTSTSEHPKYFASMSYPSIYQEYKNIPEVFPHMKNILVKRGLKNIIATRTNRKERPRDLNKAQAFNTPLAKIFRDNEIEKILHFFDTYEELQQKYPEQFLVVEFEDLVKDTDVSMKKVADFLGIEFEDILTVPTRDGIELKYEGLSFIGEENDDYRKLLTDAEIKLIERREKLYRIFKRPYNVLSIKQNLVVVVNALKKFVLKLVT